MSLIQKHSCAACARRKVKCDRLIPCSNCSRGRSKCSYATPALSQRHRKRPPDEDLLCKIREYEYLLRKNNVKFQPLDNLWIPSILEGKLIPRPVTTRVDRHAQIETSSKPEQHVGTQSSEDSNILGTPPEAVTLWFGLPKEVGGPIPAYKSRLQLSDDSCKTARPSNSSSPGQKWRKQPNEAATLASRRRF